MTNSAVRSARNVFITRRVKLLLGNFFFRNAFFRKTLFLSPYFRVGFSLIFCFCTDVGAGLGCNLLIFSAAFLLWTEWCKWRVDLSRGQTSISSLYPAYIFCLFPASENWWIPLPPLCGDQTHIYFDTLNRYWEKHPRRCFPLKPHSP